MPDSNEIDWSLVTRRTTKDANTGETIDDDYRVQSRKDEYLKRELPRGPRDIRTLYYFRRQELGQTDRSDSLEDEPNVMYYSLTEPVDYYCIYTPDDSRSVADSEESFDPC